jgi:hypothetical protein
MEEEGHLTNERALLLPMCLPLSRPVHPIPKRMCRLAAAVVWLSDAVVVVPWCRRCGGFHQVSMVLKPFGFFDASPVMDLPPATRRQTAASVSNNQPRNHHTVQQLDCCPQGELSHGRLVHLCECPRHPPTLAGRGGLGD